MELTIQLPHGEERLGVTGAAERNLKIIRESLGVTVSARNGSLRLSGDSDAVGRAAHVIEQLGDAAQRQKPLSRQQLLDAIANVERVETSKLVRRDTGGPKAPLGDQLDVYLRGRSVKPMTEGQRTYLNALLNHDLTFCCGPAGTGKTYVAVAAAVAMLKRGDVRKLVLARPAVEAGEKLGFLPGTMQEKVNPYLRPLLDALHDMMEFDQISRYMAADLIEIVPLAFMRGRTLNDATIILDEAQNTTKSQMLMFLTRLGHGSKMIVTGDTSQIDLEDPRESGLVDAIHRLGKTRGVASVALDSADIVRHHLVQRIVAAYGEQKTDSRPPAT
ncbi:PhoH family protein [Phycisphaerales bacterium AB-hyl4]|uniref:PhoH-like protein n=1 Tax=Natronomicrosphaera hydrolytica TaxID=3242702 RepID=A0ABV4U410_9BACT